jgi:hypothetical protein
MTKQGVEGKYQITLNEKYEIYMNNMRRIINTNTHKIKSTNYKKVQVIYHHLGWVRQLVYCNPLGTQTVWLQLLY